LKFYRIFAKEKIIIQKDSLDSKEPRENFERRGWERILLPLPFHNLGLALDLSSLEVEAANAFILSH